MPIYTYVSIISAWTRIKDIQADAEMRRPFYILCKHRKQYTI